MKGIILIAVCCFLFLNVAGQGHHLKSWCDRQNCANKSQVTLPGFVLRICADEPDLKPLMKSLRSLKILSLGKPGKGFGNFEQDFDKALRADGYEEMITVKENGEQFGVYIISNEERIHSILLAVKDKAEVILLSAKVDMTMRQLEKLLSGSGREQLKGLVSRR